MWPLLWFVAGVYTAHRCDTVATLTTEHVDRLFDSVQDWLRNNKK